MVTFLLEAMRLVIIIVAHQFESLISARCLMGIFFSDANIDLLKSQIISNAVGTLEAADAPAPKNHMILNALKGYIRLNSAKSIIKEKRDKHLLSAFP